MTASRHGTIGPHAHGPVYKQYVHRPQCKAHTKDYMEVGVCSRARCASIIHVRGHASRLHVFWRQAQACSSALRLDAAWHTQKGGARSIGQQTARGLHTLRAERRDSFLRLLSRRLASSWGSGALSWRPQGSPYAPPYAHCHMHHQAHGERGGPQASQLPPAVAVAPSL